VNLVELLEAFPDADRQSLACACPDNSPLAQALDNLRVRRIDFRFSDTVNQFRLVGRRFSLTAALRSTIAVRHAARRLTTICRQFQPRAVVSCTNKDHFAAAAACRKCSLPAIWWVNDLISADFFPWAARAAFKRRAQHGASRLVVVSNCAREPLRQLGVDEQRLVTVYNGIPPAAWRRTTRGHLREMFHLPSTEPLIGMVGRFTPWKGQDFFLRIAQAWISQHPAGHFILIGQAFNEDQPFEAGLRQFVATQSLAARVHFAPFQQPLAPALSDLDVFLHCSIRPEPFGRVIIESMAVGVPVIAARAGGVPEIISEGRDGLLAAPGDLPEYLAQLTKLLASAGLRQSLARAAQETVQRRFTVARVAREFAALLETVTRE
jgi:glycosyltransferase involved in cell wall biosynthesis